MTVLITGAGGFVGSYIAQYLASKNIETIASVRTVKNAWRLANDGKIKFIEADLFNEKDIEGIFKAVNPDQIIHCAWTGSSRHERDSPGQEKNLVATKKLIEKAAQSKCKSFIGLGTQAEYGVYNETIKENFDPKPATLYGKYKFEAGLTGKEIAEANGLNYAWLRLFSAFGPKDNDGYIVPSVVKSFLKDESPELTSCEQKWDYLYVKDIPKLIWNVLERKEVYCDIYNFCSANARSLRDIILKIKELMHSDMEPKFGAIKHREDGLMFLEGDNNKFKSDFGWTELTGLDTALSETIDWYKQSGLGAKT